MEPLDPEALLATLLAEAPFLTRLARALCGAGPDADEAVQETWMVALAAPPRELGSPRGWLAATLRGRIANRARGAERRRGRERAVARAEAQVGADSDLERIELQEQLLRSLRALPKGQREVLVLRFYEECGTAEIARRLGLGESGVRMRLARGLEGLRERLDKNTAGGRQRWMAALVPAARLAPAGRDVVAGAIVMNKLSTGAGVVLALLFAAGAVRLWPRAAEPELVSQGGAALVTLESPDEPVGTDETRAAEVEDAPDRVGVEPVAAGKETAAELDVRALWSDGTPAVGATIGLWVRDAQASRKWRLHSEVEADGRARFRELPEGLARIASDRSGQGLEAPLVQGERREVEFRFGEGEVVRGRVVDEDGRGVADAEVWVRPSRTRFSFSVVNGHSDAGGRFVLRDLGSSAAMAARAEGHRPSLEFEVESLVRGADGALELELEVGGPGARLGGRVTDPQGLPVAGAQVLMGPRGAQVLRDPNGRPASWASAPWVHSDDDGRFELPRDLHFGVVRLHVLAPGWPEWSEVVTLSSRQRVDVQVRLEPGVTLSGLVSDLEGAPVVGAIVEFARRAFTHRLDYDVPAPNARSGDAGRYVLQGLTAGSGKLLARGPVGSLGQALVAIELVAGSNNLDLRLDPEPAIRGRVLGADGRPQAGLQVHSWSQGEEDQWEIAMTGPDGEFMLPNLGAGPHRLAAVHLDLWSNELAVLDDVEPGGPAVELRILAENLATAWIEGTVDVALSERYPGLRVLVQERGSNTSYYVDTAEGPGAFEYGPLSPGDYDVRVETAGRWLMLVSAQELRDGERRDLGLLVAEEPGEVVLRFDAAWQPFVASLWLERAEGSREDLRWVDGEARSGEVAPGAYTLRGSWPGQSVPRLELRVYPGERRVLDVDLRDTRPVQLRLQSKAEIEDSLQMRLWDAQGQKINGLEIAAMEREGPTELLLTLVLAEGAYVLWVGSGEAAVRASFEVGPVGSEAGPLVLQLVP